MPQGYNPSFRVMPLGHKLGRKTIMARLMPLGHKVSAYGIHDTKFDIGFKKINMRLWNKNVEFFYVIFSESLT